MFIGYSRTQKGYVRYSPTDDKLIVSADITFCEDQPFHYSPSTPSPSFPVARPAVPVTTPSLPPLPSPLLAGLPAKDATRTREAAVRRKIGDGDRRGLWNRELEGATGAEEVEESNKGDNTTLNPEKRREMFRALLIDAAWPFLHARTERFADELELFLASGLNIDAYDEVYMHHLENYSSSEASGHGQAAD
ncbi:hypothetical protein KSP40_PGU013770 [Platanthera guangdongensis]|uniref:Retroviral polymerase SH3-like domain-containing protein n=1 Tax=Platanthera guangdongensis TaxID=2320717 RepID=A0ABR2LSN1_9ASPA